MTPIAIQEDSSGADYSFIFTLKSRNEFFKALKECATINDVEMNEKPFEDDIFGQFKTVSFEFMNVQYLWTDFKGAAEITFFCNRDDKVINQSINALYNTILSNHASSQIEFVMGGMVP